MADLTIKRGDTFAYTAKFEGAQLSNLKSQVRTSLKDLVADVDIIETSEPFTFLFIVHDTSDWEEGTLLTDIKRSSNGITTSTTTVKIIVESEVTQ